MSEWIVEAGIGETRAALIEDGTIVEAALELPGGVRAGTLAAGRLTGIVAPRRAGVVALDGGGEALLQPLPRGLTEGAALTVEITREAIGHKRPLCRAASGEPRPGPDLLARARATGKPVRILHCGESDALEAAGWSELLEAADTGIVPFSGGSLLISLTPAMTLFDVDGTLAPDALAIAGAAAAGRAIRRFGIAGSIGIDLPTVGDRAVRIAAADALDAALPRPFERTAINGFGFLQIVRPQQRASLPQIVAVDRAGAAARALLRRAERTPGAGPRTLSAHPAVIARLQSAWTDELARRVGAPVALRPHPGIAMSAGHVDAQHP